LVSNRCFVRQADSRQAGKLTPVEALHNRRVGHQEIPHRRDATWMKFDIHPPATEIV